jgi:hypothetical protein
MCNTNCYYVQQIIVKIQWNIAVCSFSCYKGFLQQYQVMEYVDNFPIFLFYNACFFQSRLVDTLISAEKHSHDGNFPLNAYRKLLVCELLPLLATENAKVDLSSKLLQKLLYKAVEFYFCYLGLSPGTTQDGESKIEDPWRRLFSVIEFIGKQLEWEPYLVNFSNNW